VLLDRWKTRHALDCAINFDGASKAMEKEATVRMWNRSLYRNLRYRQMLSDGDSIAVKVVCDAQPYSEEVSVEKLECINHCHKRMGTTLRKAQKEKQLRSKGHGKLTLEKCNLLQTYYRYAIVKNTSNTADMGNAIWATLLHSQSTDEEPQHSMCPRGQD
jgi:hypothetical protein